MTQNNSTHTLLRICALLVIPLVLGGVLLLSNQVQAAPDLPDANPHRCTIDHIAVYDSRIHVRCTNPLLITRPAPLPPLSIYYFAANGDEAHMITTNRFLTLLNSGFALGKQVDIGWFTSTDQNPPGCLTNDCRGIDFLVLLP